MGKKGVILDNGKKAQSSMALYWKNNKERQKLPKEKKEKPEDEEKANDKAVMSNFEKWKLHKEKLITKAYSKPEDKEKLKLEQERQKQQEEEEEERVFESMFMNKQRKEEKIIKLPGFKSKEGLTDKIEVEKAREADQSTNILQLPSHMADLTQEDIVRILREKKAKKEFERQLKERATKTAANKKEPDENEDVLLGEEFIDLMRNKEKEEIQAQKEAEANEIEEAKKQAERKKEETFFKSDLLNKINMDGTKELDRIKAEKEQKIKEEVDKIENEKLKKQQEELERKAHNAVLNAQGRFIPRVLMKK